MLLVPTYVPSGMLHPCVNLLLKIDTRMKHVMGYIGTKRDTPNLRVCMKIKFRCATINNERGGRIGIPNI